MPSAAANDLQSSASFSARNSPGRLTISAARTNMVRLIRRTMRPQRIPANTPAVFSRLRARICQHLLCLATKDDSDRLLSGAMDIGYGVVVQRTTLEAKTSRQLRSDKERDDTSRSGGS